MLVNSYSYQPLIKANPKPVFFRGVNVGGPGNMDEPWDSNGNPIPKKSTPQKFKKSSNVWEFLKRIISSLKR